VAAAASKAAELAGRVGDAFVTTAPEAELVKKFEQAGGDGKTKYGMVTACWAQSEEEARKTAHEWWPNAGIEGDLSQELPLPEHFEQAAATVTEDDLAETMPLGPDPEQHLEQIRQFAEAGIDHVYVHQVGPDQHGFMRFYAEEIIPQLSGVLTAR
jgi:G6PDH family F420-dependent oxidoreductase